MNIQVTKGYLMIFICLFIILMQAIFIGYPKYKDHQEKQSLQNFFEIDTERSKS